MADSITVLAPGLLTTLQDAGRYGYQASGFSPAGAMDYPAMRTANLLVGNSPDMPVLEMTLAGLSCEFNCDCVFAMTGARMDAKLNGRPCKRYRTQRAAEGDVLTVGSALLGCRGYLAIGGGFDVSPVMGSCATSLKFGLGGFDGKKLSAGDVLKLQTPGVPYRKRTAKVPWHLRKDRSYFGDIHIRCVLGPQEEAFTAEGLRTFLSAPYKVTPASDRMGIKLEGAQIEAKDGYDIISDGIAMGCVQVPASGMPIVMMADRQTTGGYTKIATVITPDLHHLAQLKPGDTVTFHAVSADEARKLYRAYIQKLRKEEYDFLRF
ncbi:MAG: biotin-dependent carboxyltransferase family protein [Oscillospiraceae bacterium]|jgi:biotin-dependent carboxylase-like uncharacterized protein|nr:biotin-dependent carboxyltransferase family protein [Oscillospiraceae bacterium]